MNGVSTRKVDRLVEQLGLRMSKSEVSRLCAGPRRAGRGVPRAAAGGPLPVPVAGRQGREGPRARGGVRQKAPGDRLRVHEIGPARGDRPRRRRGRDRGVLARLPARAGRARPGRRAALRLRRPRRACEQAIGKVLGCPWQRCTVHFLRDMLGHVPQAPAAAGRRRASARSSPPPSRDEAAPARWPTWSSGSSAPRRRSRGCSRRPRTTCWPSTLPARALAEAALDEPAGAGQPRDRPAHRRRRHLPQRRRPDPARRRAARRAERRVAGRPPLPLARLAWRSSSGAEQAGPCGPAGADQPALQGALAGAGKSTT